MSKSKRKRDAVPEGLRMLRVNRPQGAPAKFGKRERLNKLKRRKKITSPMNIFRLFRIFRRTLITSL